MTNSVEKMPRKGAVKSSVPAMATPGDLMALAVLKDDADLDRLERLMIMQKEWEANEARKAFTASMADFRIEVPKITKNRTVRYSGKGGQTTSYNHADLAYMMEVIGPIVGKHGLSYTYRSAHPTKNSIKVTCILTHRDGHFTETSLEADYDNSGGKNTIQSLGSSSTYLKRYTLKLALGLAEADDDNDGADGSNEPEYIADDQKTTIILAIQEIEKLMGDNNDGKETKRFLNYLKIQNVDQLPKSRFSAAMTALNNRKAML
jgi:hypothetical protein